MFCFQSPSLKYFLSAIISEIKHIIINAHIKVIDSVPTTIPPIYATSRHAPKPISIPISFGIFSPHFTLKPPNYKIVFIKLKGGEKVER